MKEDRERARECSLPDNLLFSIAPDAKYWDEPHRKRLVNKIMGALAAVRRDEELVAAAREAGKFLDDIARCRIGGNERDMKAAALQKRIAALVEEE